MLKKLHIYEEWAYVLGQFIIGLGAILLVTADFGVSVVVAPAYIIYLALSETFSFVTFGLAEYMLQGTLLVILMLVVRRFHPTYLCSIITTFIYGRIIDMYMKFFAMFTFSFVERIGLYILGCIFCAIGIAFFMYTYLSPQIYELVLKEGHSKFNAPVSKVKIIYDSISCVVALAFSFSFFGFPNLVGIGIGTIVAVPINGKLIAIASGFFQKHITFSPRFPKAMPYFSPPPFQRKEDASEEVKK